MFRGLQHVLYNQSYKCSRNSLKFFNNFLKTYCRISAIGTVGLTYELLNCMNSLTNFFMFMCIHLKAMKIHWNVTNLQKSATLVPGKVVIALFILHHGA